MRHFLIDTDTASDDAVALIMALNHPDVKVEAITVVAGNVPLDQAVQNALYTTELCGYEGKIYRGANKPLIRPLQTAQFVHGEDGMGDVGLELHGRVPHTDNAIDIIIDTIERYPNEIELVTLGPLTNIAIAILKEPSIVHKVKKCVVMGGIGQGVGNVTPVSEYNIWADPEAAHIVFSSGMNIRMVGWDISRQFAIVDEEKVAQIRAIDTPLAHFAMDIQRKVREFALQTTKLAGFDLPDPIAMAIALDERIATIIKKTYVEVVLSEGITRGQTVVDHNNQLTNTYTIEVVLEASADVFFSLLLQSLQQKISLPD